MAKKQIPDISKITGKELMIAAKLLKMASEQFSNHGCNDLDDDFWEGWTMEERKKFVNEYDKWNSGGEEYFEGWIHLPDYAVMGYLAYKLENTKI